MSDPACILIIEDDAILGGAVTQRLKLEGFEPVWVQSAAQAITAMKRRRPDFVLSDIVLPDGSGEDLYRQAQPYLGETPIVFATAYGEIEQAVRLVKAGADDYLTKPFDVDDLIERIRATHVGDRDKTDNGDVLVFATSPATQAIADMLRRAADSDLPVLITGETGTGKELAARYLHHVSRRSSAPFVAVNCGAIPDELLESQFFGHERGAFTGAVQAHMGFFAETGEGTLFLDEIGELDARLQTALLRVLQDGGFRPVGSRTERRFAGRVVAATNADLAQLRRQRRFRDDLYFRLAVVEIAIPPLRERPAEIEPFAVRFLDQAARRQGRRALRLSEEARAALLRHSWPGNVRELRNRLERATVFSEADVLKPHDIFHERNLESTAPASLEEARRHAETDQIDRALALANGRIGEAAKLLGISRTTLWKRMSRRDGR